MAPSSRLLVSRWATFLGVSGAALAAAQYIPQIIHTSKAKLVGSLSVHMMLLQVPGSAIFVYSVSLSTLISTSLHSDRLTRDEAMLIRCCRIL